MICVVSAPEYLPWWLDDVPDIFNRITEFATCYTSTQAVVAYTDGIVLEAVGKIVVTFGHCTDEYANALFGPQVRDVVLDPNDICVIAECNLTAIWGQMICDGIFDHFEKLLLRIC